MLAIFAGDRPLAGGQVLDRRTLAHGDLHAIGKLHHPDLCTGFRGEEGAPVTRDGGQATLLLLAD